MRRKLLWIVGALFVLAGASLALVMQHASRQTQRARELLEAVNGLRVEVSTSEDVRQVAHRFKDLCSPIVPCDRPLCYCDCTVTNRLFWKLHLAPAAVFLVSLTTADGRLVSKSVTMQVGDRGQTYGYRGASAAESRDWTPKESPFWTFANLEYGGEALGEKPKPSAKYREVNVKLKPSATDDQRRRAFAFNVGCLSKLGGCRDVRDILPLIAPGERWPPNAICCPFRLR